MKNRNDSVSSWLRKMYIQVEFFDIWVEFIAKTDKDRADYYKYYTGREWTDARNYDLCLDSSKLGFERCVEEIIAYMNVRFK